MREENELEKNENESKDAKINFDQHVSNICRASFANIRALRQIRPTREDATRLLVQ